VLRPLGFKLIRLRSFNGVSPLIPSNAATISCSNMRFAANTAVLDGSAAVWRGACPLWGWGRHFCRARETAARSINTASVTIRPLMLILAQRVSQISAETDDLAKSELRRSLACRAVTWP